MIRAHSTHVGIARTRSRDADARRALERIAGALDVRPSRLPASAILVMRSMRCRVHRPLAECARDARSLRAIAHDARDAVENAASRAVRVIDEPSGAASDAVYFEDYAELLACLARDWAKGDIGARWWWRQLLRDTWSETALVNPWSRDPPSIPRALELLIRSGDATAFLKVLRREHKLDLARAVVDAYGMVCEVETLVRKAMASPGARSSRPGDVSHSIHALLQLAGDELDVASGVLVAVALSAQRMLDAGEARLVSVIRALAGSNATASRAPMPAPRQSPRDSRAKPRANAPPALPDGMNDAFVDEPTSSAATEVRPRKHADPLYEQKSVTARPHHPLALEHDSTAVVMDRFGTQGLNGLAQDAQPPQDAMVLLEEGDPGWACETRFGGLFYVLNALLCMNVYGDFMQPRRRPIDLGPWDFLAICGEQWFGARFANDPLAAFLARLAGRERGDPIERPRWMRRLMPFIEARISQALGEHRTRRALVRLAVSRARAVDSGTRLDVHFELSRLPLAVRFAGLDRDPGWIPAAARIVAFHFD